MISSCFYLLDGSLSCHVWGQWSHIAFTSHQRFILSDGSVVIALSYLIISWFFHKAMSVIGGSLIYMDVCIICQTGICKLLICTLHSPPSGAEGVYVHTPQLRVLEGVSVGAYKWCFSLSAGAPLGDLLQ